MYMYDPIQETFISDEPVRKPASVPPKTTGIKKLSKGGSTEELTKNQIIVANMNPLEVGMLTKGDKEKLKVVRSIKAKADRINKKSDPILVASDYTDPNDVIMDILPEIKETLMEEFKSLQRDGYKGTFLDYIKSELDLKRRTGRAKGGPAKQNLIERTPVDQMALSSAMSKISDAMSGIGGIIGRRFMDSGGPANKPKDPKIKTINLADYFKAGVAVADLTPSEKEQVNLLLKKMLSGTKDN